MLETALTVDQSGHLILENQITASREWSGLSRAEWTLT